MDVRPALYVCPDLDEMEDKDLDDTSDTEDALGLEVISGAVDGAVVDLFSSGSCSGWTLITLERERDTLSILTGLLNPTYLNVSRH